MFQNPCNLTLLFYLLEVCPQGLRRKDTKNGESLDRIYKKVKAETKAAESAKKAEAEDVLKKLLASGVSADDILAKLK